MQEDFGTSFFHWKNKSVTGLTYARRPSLNVVKRILTIFALVMLLCCSSRRQLAFIALTTRLDLLKVLNHHILASCAVDIS